MNVIPYGQNAKKHPDKQLLQIAKSLKEFGWRQPIVVDKNGVIIVGHGRWFAWQKYGKELELKEPWIEKAEDLTDEQVRAYRLADNKLNESEWDMDLAIPELRGLSDEMLDLTGFDRDLLIEPDEKDDVVPENAPTRAKIGDVWVLGRHRVVCGDSTKKEDVGKLMDGKKADMVFTDPPYALFGNSTGMSGVTDDKMIQPFFRDVFSNRIFSKGGCHWYTCCDWRTYPVMALCQSESGLTVKQLVIWDKMSPGMGNLYRNQYECIVVSINTPTNQGKLSGKASNKMRVTDTNVWQIKRHKEGLHNAEKPVELISRAIDNSSHEEDIVLDLFLGSGSTLIAAEKTGRICYGMEIEPKYVDVAIKRYIDYTGNDVVRLRNGKEEIIKVSDM